VLIFGNKALPKIGAKDPPAARVVNPALSKLVEDFHDGRDGGVTPPFPAGVRRAPCRERDLFAPATSDCP
jgi:hypothetical protein